MKKQHHHIFVLLVALTGIVLFPGCKKSFLEVVPKGSLIAATTEDYGRLLTNASLLNVSIDHQVMLGDDVAAIQSLLNNSTTREQRLFRWEDEVYEPSENAPELDGFMTNIYLYNKIINEVMMAEGPEQQRRSLRAEALAGRAWVYFHLINYYGKPYNAATAATDPGFPLVSTTDVTQMNFTRASVEEVYARIVSDLEAAVPDLPERLLSRMRMSRPFGKAMLGKVYMFMQKFDKALPLLNDAFNDLAGSALPVRLYNYNQTFATGGAFLPIQTLGGPTYPSSSANEENIFARQFSNVYSFFNNTFVLAPAATKLFKSSDLRLKFFVNRQFPSGALPAGTLRRIGQNLTQTGVTLPDLYLLRAECKVRNNDLPGAVEDVFMLRKNRMPEADASVAADTAADKMRLLHFILEERTREFAVQGYRWLDMRRLSVDPLFNGITFTHQAFAADGSAVTYTLRPGRLLLRFPPKIMEQNPGMPNNL